MYVVCVQRGCGVIAVRLESLQKSDLRGPATARSSVAACVRARRRGQQCWAYTAAPVPCPTLMPFSARLAPLRVAGAPDVKEARVGGERSTWRARSSSAMPPPAARERAARWSSASMSARPAASTDRAALLDTSSASSTCTFSPRTIPAEHSGTRQRPRGAVRRRGRTRRQSGGQPEEESERYFQIQLMYFRSSGEIIDVHRKQLPQHGRLTRTGCAKQKPHRRLCG
jgi:hypothetical protein